MLLRRLAPAGQGWSQAVEGWSSLFHIVLTMPRYFPQDPGSEDPGGPLPPPLLLRLH